MLWVDALSYPTKRDLEEPNEQVSFITKIYQQAWHVISWLGPDADIK